MGSGSPEHGGGREEREKAEEAEEVRFPYSPRAMVERGGGATVAYGGGQRRAWRRRCGLGEGHAVARAVMVVRSARGAYL